MGSLRLLLSETDHDVDLCQYHWSSEGFTKLQQIVDPLYYQKPFEERARIAASLYADQGAEVPRLIRKALSLGPLPSLAYPHADSWADDLLHRVAKGMGMVKVFGCNGHGPVNGGDSIGTSPYVDQYKVSSQADQ